MQQAGYYTHTDETQAFQQEFEMAKQRQDRQLENIEKGLSTLKGGYHAALSLLYRHAGGSAVLLGLLVGVWQGWCSCGACCHGMQACPAAGGGCSWKDRA